MYLYTLEDDAVFKTPFKFNRNFIGRHNGKIWVLVDIDGVIRIKKGYAWNGASPKFKINGKIYGAPEGKTNKDGYPKTYHATLIHDALCQFRKDLPFTEKQIHALFHLIMIRDRFKYSGIYYAAVRLFYGLYSKLFPQ